MATRKKTRVILQPKTGPVHLDGLVAWIKEENEDPPVCRECNSNKDVIHRWGEWICRSCGRIVDA